LYIYAGLGTAAGLIWLTAGTDWSLLYQEAWVLLVFLLLRLALAWFDFSMLDGATPYTRGAQARLVSWSAVLLFGITAVWLELISALVDWWRQGRPFSPHNLIPLIRDLLPPLLAITLYQQWGGDVPLAGLTAAGVLPALSATAIHIGTTTLLLIPIFLLLDEHTSGLARLISWLQFGRNALLFFVLPIPFGILAAAIYGQSGLGAYLFLMTAVLLLTALGYRLGQTAVSHRQESEEKSHLIAEYETALRSQAETYQAEVYTQAYQAEMYAQALTYQKMSQELALAWQIQASFLPDETPDIPGWQLAVALEPARETSGDFYDFIELADGRLAFLIADVADKGIGPALYMAVSRTLIRTFATENGSHPAQVLAAANRRLFNDTHSDLFVTVFFAVLEPDTGKLTYCNAGHNPPFIVQSHNGNHALPLTRTALPLGILEDSDWQQASAQMEHGDLLLLYTDGITEAQDEEEGFFGEMRLQVLARANIGRSAEVIEDKVITAVYDFVGDAEQFDDMTLMVIVRE
jgi:serine phosphatase RsbU (regulator of sigma subunit)